MVTLELENLKTKVRIQESSSTKPQLEYNRHLILNSQVNSKNNDNSTIDKQVTKQDISRIAKKQQTVPLTNR